VSALGVTAFVAALVGAVLVHELFHLLGARWSGMRVDRYFVGFGPTLWSTRRGETEVGLKLLPLGGFVRIVGMDPEDPVQPPLVDELPEPEGDGAVWADALEVGLRARGARAETARRIRDAARGVLSAAPAGVGAGAGGPRDRATAAVTAAVEAELGPTRRVGDLAHRVLRGDEGRRYGDRPARQRALAIVLGPLSHAAIAFVLLLGIQLGWPQPTGELTTVVAAVQQGSPADAAGLRAGDRLLAVAGVASDDFLVLRDGLRGRPGQPVDVRVERAGAVDTVRIVPEPVETVEGTVGLIGIAVEPVVADVGVVDAVVAAAVGEPRGASPGGVVPLARDSVAGLVRILSPQGLTDLVGQAVGAEERDPTGAVSLVGAASIAGQIGARDGGLPVLLALLAAINVFFMLFNLVPLPPFDGGHLAVIGVESAVNGLRRLRGRAADFRVRPEALTALAAPVMAVLVLLLVATLWLDVTSPIRL
jgi:regulator of sigma E protease